MGKTSLVSLLHNIFSRNHKQYLYDNLSSALNVWCSDLSTLYEQKLKKYEVKQRKYKELYNSLEKDYVAELLFATDVKSDSLIFCDSLLFNNNKNNCFSKSSLSIKERLDITERLINLATQIIEKNNFSVEIEFALLENRLGYELDFVTSLYPQFYSESEQNLHARELQIQIKFILALIKECTRYLFRNFNSDLRFRYRSIVHFLFKNMDDESDESNNLPAFLKHRLLPIFNYSFNGKQGSNFTIEKHWKRRFKCCIN
jgi:hypothetical protein